MHIARVEASEIQLQQDYMSSLRRAVKCKCISTHLWGLFEDIRRVGEVGRQAAGRGRGGGGRGGGGLRAPGAC